MITMTCMQPDIEAAEMAEQISEWVRDNRQPHPVWSYSFVEISPAMNLTFRLAQDAFNHVSSVLGGASTLDISCIEIWSTAWLEAAALLREGWKP